MVSTLTVVNLVISVVLVLGSPLVVFWMFRSEKGIFRTMAAGAMGFFLAQYVVRLPFLNGVLSSTTSAFILNHVWLYAVVLGFSAALFQLVLRVVMLKWFMSDYQQKHHVISAGFGHGVLEAIFLVAIPHLNSIVLSIMINSNRINELFQDASDPNLVNQIVEGFINVNSWIFLAGGIERLMVIVIQISLTVLVFKGLQEKAHRFKYWAIALLIQTALESLVVVLQLNNASLWIIEVVVFVFMLASISIIKDFYDTKKSEVEVQ